MSMSIWVTAVLVGTALLVWGLQREFERLERESPRTSVTVTFEVIDRLTPALLRLKEQMATMLPAAEQAGVAFKAFASAMQIPPHDSKPAPPAASGADGGAS